MKRKFWSLIMISSFSIILALGLNNICWAFNDWVDTSESCTPGATDYTGYINYLWRVVEDHQSKVEQEMNTTLKSQEAKELDEDKKGY